MIFDKPNDESLSHIEPPTSLEMLLERCENIAGQTIGQLAHAHGLTVPADLRRHKGWVGMLLERVLGADAGSRAEPDFMGLGVELKTLPLNQLGEPKESTYVCTVDLQAVGNTDWQESWLRRKLSHVLWVPIEAENRIPLSERYIGQAWLWQPSAEQFALLQRDWEELMDRVILGEQADITAHEGQYLQIRPKAANSRALVMGVSSEGLAQKINPKGFYLRTAFTRLLLEQGRVSNDKK